MPASFCCSNHFLPATFSDAGVHMGICRSVKNVICKPTPNAVRADAFDTGFYIRADAQRPKEASQVTFITQTDPKGAYPSWLTDAVNETQAGFLVNIRAAMNRMLVGESVKTILLEKDMIVTVEATFLDQQLALWAFQRQNLNEIMTMSRTRRTLKKIVPEPGDFLYSNLGNEMLEVLEDTREDQSKFYNAQLAHRGYTESDAEEIHRPACEHLHQQLMQYGLSPPEIPLPWPLWSIPQLDGIVFSCGSSDATVGESIKLRACQDCVVVVGSCLTEEDPQKRSEENIQVSSSLKFWPRNEIGDSGFLDTT